MQLESAIRQECVLPTLLWVDTDRATTTCRDVLAAQFRVSSPGAAHTAVEFLRRTTTPPDFVATEVAFADGLGYEICRLAKGLAIPSTVLVMTSVVELVPDAIAAGCDAVLLKPFPPNLLLSRLARLKRARVDGVHARASRALARSRQLRDLVQQMTARIFQDSRDGRCPRCSHEGAVCFEYSSHRRAWYACLACKKVWLARRHG